MGGRDVGEVVGALVAGDSDPAPRVAHASTQLGLRRDQVEAALAYHADHTDEIDAEIGTNRAIADEAEELLINDAPSTTRVWLHWLAEAPGNVEIGADTSGLDRDSVVNISQIVTLDKAQVTDWVGTAGPEVMGRIEAGLGLVLGLR